MECERGYYCLKGQRFPCPAGKFGPDAGMFQSTQCLPCDPGFVCPEASWAPRKTEETDNDVRECGSPSVFCAEGSATATLAETGYYTAGGDSETTQAESKLCEAGYYCLAGSRFKCPPGRYGSEPGLASVACSGPCLAGNYGAEEGATHPVCDGVCSAGYVCPAGSTSPTQTPCGGIDVFCPAGSASAQFARAGYYTDGPSVSHRVNETICEPGYWCSGGVKSLCPAGRYGATAGLSSAGCTGPCGAGFVCLAGATHPTLLPDTDYGQNYTTVTRCGTESVYCPQGSGAALLAAAGFYTVGDTTATRVDQEACEAGYVSAWRDCVAACVRCSRLTYSHTHGVSWLQLLLCCRRCPTVPCRTIRRRTTPIIVRMLRLVCCWPLGIARAVHTRVLWPMRGWALLSRGFHVADAVSVPRWQVGRRLPGERQLQWAVQCWVLLPGGVRDCDAGAVWWRGVFLPGGVRGAQPVRCRVLHHTSGCRRGATYGSG